MNVWLTMRWEPKAVPPLPVRTTTDRSSSLILMAGVPGPATASRRRTHHSCDRHGERLIWRRREVDPGPIDETESQAQSDLARLRPVLEAITACLGKPSDVRFEMRHSRRDIWSDGQCLHSRISNDVYVVLRAAGRSTKRWIRDVDGLESSSCCGRCQSPQSPAGSLPELESGRANIVLSSHVAGVLLHEMVGHSSEERDIVGGELLLPAGTDVVAPVGPAPDDPAASAAPTRLVKDGYAAAQPCTWIPGQHWQRAPHGLNASLRFPLLDVQARRATSRADVVGDHLVCSSVTAARYFRGKAVLEVPDAMYCRDGESSWQGSARVLVATDNLAAAAFLEQPQQGLCALDGTGGTCTKNGENLPTFVDTPPLALPAASVWLADTT